MPKSDERKETVQFRDHLMFVWSFCFNHIQMLDYFPPPDFKNTAGRDVTDQLENQSNSQNLKHLHLFYSSLLLFYLVSGFFFNLIKQISYSLEKILVQFFLFKLPEILSKASCSTRRSTTE